MVTGIIVSDDISGREKLFQLIEEHCENIHISDVTDNVGEALSIIRHHKNDIVFFDVNTPGGNGFDLLEVLEPKPLIVLVTEYPEFAAKALKKDAYDAILKPFSAQNVSERVSKVVEELYSGTRFSEIEATSGGLCRLKINDAKGPHLIDIKNIIYLQADNNYTTIHIENPEGEKKFVASRTLGDFETILPGENFFRVHKSYIINVNKMKRYSKEAGSYVLMNNDNMIEIARRKVSPFRRYLNERVKS